MIRLIVPLVIGLCGGFLLGAEFSGRRGDALVDASVHAVDPQSDRTVPASAAASAPRARDAARPAPSGSPSSGALFSALRNAGDVPAHALEAALRGDGDALTTELAFRSLSLTDLATALDRLAALGAGPSAAAAARGVFLAGSADDERLGAVLAAAPSPSAARDWRGALLEAWAERDGAAALQRALELPPPSGDEVLVRVVRRWASRDPKAVLDRASSISVLRADLVRREAVAQWASQAPEAVLAWIADAPDGEPRGQYGSALAVDVRSVEQVRQLQAALGVPGGFVPMAAITALASIDPEGAYGLALEMGPRFRDSVLATMGEAIGRADPRRAVEFLRTVDEGRDVLFSSVLATSPPLEVALELLADVDDASRGQALQAFGTGLVDGATRDAFADFLAGETGETRDAGWSGLVFGLRSGTPRDALNWVLTRSDVPDAAYASLSYYMQEADSSTQEAFLAVAPPAIGDEFVSRLRLSGVDLDPEATAREALKTTSPREAGELMQLLASTDVERALRALSGVPAGDVRRASVRSLAETWHGRDAAAAQRWIASLAGADRQAAMHGYVATLARTDRDAAQAVVLAERPGTERDELLAQLALRAGVLRGEQIDHALFEAVSSDIHRAAMATVALSRVSDPQQRAQVLRRHFENEQLREVVEAQIAFVSRF